jgi:hypothetical protein
MVERGEEHVDGPVATTDEEKHRAALYVASRAQDADDCRLLLDALGLQPSRRQRAAYAALQAPFRPALWAVCAALIATATTTHLTHHRGTRNA